MGLEWKGKNGHVLNLTRISVWGFKAVDRFTMRIDPSLTLLLGKNGAGKSSILQAFALLRHLADGTPARFFDDRGWDRKALRFRSPNNRSSILRVSAIFESERWGRVRWSIRWGLNTGTLQSEQVDLRRNTDSEPIKIVAFDQKRGGNAGKQDLPPLRFEGSLLSAIQDQEKGDEADGVVRDLHAWLTSIQSLELLSPAAMKGATRLSIGDMGARGNHLAGFLAALTSEQRSRVVNRIARFYPLDDLETVHKRAGWIDLILSERFAHFSLVPWTQMSDGFMRMLALCAIPELPDPSVVLLDELEDGIEPHILGRLVALVTSETRAQIIATSHSPILANVVGANGLRLISRTPDGRTVAAEINKMPSFRLGSDYFGPGELWTNTDLQVLESEALDLANNGQIQAGVDEL